MGCSGWSTFQQLGAATAASCSLGYVKYLSSDMRYRYLTMAGASSAAPEKDDGIAFQSQFEGTSIYIIYSVQIVIAHITAAMIGLAGFLRPCG